MMTIKPVLFLFGLPGNYLGKKDIVSDYCDINFLDDMKIQTYYSFVFENYNFIKNYYNKRLLNLGSIGDLEKNRTGIDFNIESMNFGDFEAYNFLMSEISLNRHGVINRNNINLYILDYIKNNKDLVELKRGYLELEENFRSIMINSKFKNFEKIMTENFTNDEIINYGVKNKKFKFTLEDVFGHIHLDSFEEKISDSKKLINNFVIGEVRRKFANLNDGLYDSDYDYFEKDFILNYYLMADENNDYELFIESTFSKQTKKNIIQHDRFGAIFRLEENKEGKLLNDIFLQKSNDLLSYSNKVFSQKMRINQAAEELKSK